jgi:glycosyltransferase involved in cell wall biosynthesis
MRIAFITSELPIEDGFSGGLANYVARTAVALAGMGHAVEVFTIGRRDESRGWQGVHIHFVTGLIDSKTKFLDRLDRIFQGPSYHPYQDAKRAWCLWRRYRQRLIDEGAHFDFVQLANAQAVGLFFKPIAGETMVTRLSSCRPLWDRQAGICEDWFVKMRWWLEEKAIRRTRFHYAPSRFVADYVQKFYNLKKVDVLESPFFQEVVEPDRSLYESKLAGKRYLLFFGRLTQMKGVHRLAEALPEVLRKHEDLHAVFAGADTNLAPGGGGMRDYIRKTIGSEFNRRVFFFDPLRHEQLYPIIENSEWVVLPSIVDNLPNTCLEAMGLGRSVIATRGSCFEQLITDGETGLLCNADDSIDLQRILFTALNISPFDREKMAEHGKASLRRLHPDMAIPALLEYYRKIQAACLWSGF